MANTVINQHFKRERGLAWLAAIVVLLNACCDTAPTAVDPVLTILSPAAGEKLVAHDSVRIAWNVPLSNAKVEFEDIMRPSSERWQPLAAGSSGPTWATVKVPPILSDTLLVRVIDTTQMLQTTARYLCRFFRIDFAPHDTAFSLGDTIRIIWHPSAAISSAVLSVVFNNGFSSVPICDRAIAYPETSFTWIVTQPDTFSLPLVGCRIKTVDYNNYNYSDITDLAFSIR